MARKEKINLIVVDDNHAFLDGIISLIRKEEKKYNLLSYFFSYEDLFKSNLIVNADILLMDLNMPGIDGIMAAKIIDAKYRSTYLVAMTMYHEDVSLATLIESGFKGLVEKNRICDDLFKVLQNVINRKIDFPKEIQI